MSARQTVVNNPLTDNRMVRAFVDGVAKTMTTMANTQCQIGEPQLVENITSSGEIAGLIGMVSGRMRGTITMSFEKAAIFTVLSNMLGDDFSEVNDDVIDAVGELTNMVYGTAKTTLNEIGYNFEMAIPTVILGSQKISSFHNGATLVIPFSCDQGAFFVEITIQ